MRNEPGLTVESRGRFQQTPLLVLATLVLVVALGAHREGAPLGIMVMFLFLAALPIAPASYRRITEFDIDTQTVRLREYLFGINFLTESTPFAELGAIVLSVEPETSRRQIALRLVTQKDLPYYESLEKESVMDDAHMRMSSPTTLQRIQRRLPPSSEEGFLVQAWPFHERKRVRSLLDDIKVATALPVIDIASNGG